MVADTGAADGAGRVRPLNTPVPVDVELDESGKPKAMLWRGAYQQVVALHDTWRIDDEWWRNQIARRYFLLELASGRRATVFHDLVADAWYLQAYRAAGQSGMHSTV